jgi:hypothetical protein
MPKRTRASEANGRSNGTNGAKKTKTEQATSPAEAGTKRKQLHLTAFMRPVSLHTGAWRYPGSYPDANFNLTHLKSFIQKLEAAKFDAFFMVCDENQWICSRCVGLTLFSG